MFLDYRTLVNSLPIQWRESRERRKLGEPIMDPVVTFIASKRSGALHVRKILAVSITRRFKNIWEGAWESRFEGINWEQIYQCLQDTPVQYRSTRYKVITRIVTTNSSLEKMRIKNPISCAPNGKL